MQGCRDGSASYLEALICECPLTSVDVWIFIATGLWAVIPNLSASAVLALTGCLLPAPGTLCCLWPNLCGWMWAVAIAKSLALL